MAIKLKKGNLVTVTATKDGKKTTYDGIVQSAGKNVVIHYDIVYSEDRTSYKYKEYKQTAERTEAFIKSGVIKFVADAKPRPALPKGLETVQCKGLKEFEASDGIAFSVNIYFKGKKVATYSNGGFGGPDEVRGEIIRKAEKYELLPLFAEFKTLVEELVGNSVLPTHDGKLEGFCSYLLNYSEEESFEDHAVRMHKEWEAFKTEHDIPQK